MTYSLVRVHSGGRTDASGSGCYCAVVTEGTKWIHGVCIDAPVRLFKMPIEDKKFCTPFPNTPVNKAVKRMLAAGKHLGITEGARAFLKEALA